MIYGKTTKLNRVADEVKNNINKTEILRMLIRNGSRVTQVNIKKFNQFTTYHKILLF